MTRVFAEQMLIEGQSYVLSIKDSHHAKHVLRLDLGADIVLIDAEKNEFLSTLVRYEENRYRAMVVKRIEVNREPQLQITLFQGLPKGDKMEQVIMRGTEVGAVGFVPVQMERSIAKINPAKLARKQERWQKIAFAAARQASRQVVPNVQSTVTFKQLLTMLSDYDLILLPYEKEEDCSLATIELSRNDLNIALIIGPEGGISVAEADKLAALGAQWVTLGPRIMRTETAGIAALAILLAKSGDMGD